MTKIPQLFAYPGAKHKLAPVVWQRFGTDVKHYVEPFAGTIAVLLNRPYLPDNAVETINDLDAHITNFWRAMKYFPEQTIDYALMPIHELDYHATGQLLADDEALLTECLRSNLYYCNPRMAGYWLHTIKWSIHVYTTLGYPRSSDTITITPEKTNQYVNSKAIPVLSDAHKAFYDRAQTMQTAKKITQRLEKVRIINGHWDRVLNIKSFEKVSNDTAVFLDPPYTGTEDIYATKTNVATDVLDWCIENGDNPDIKICLCGYEGNEKLAEHGWTPHYWESTRGHRNIDKNQSHKTEVAWFNPQCHQPQPDLFDTLEVTA